MKAITAPPKLKNQEFDLVAQDCAELARVSTSFQQTNKTLSETVAKWIAKNLKKMKAPVDQYNAERKSLFDEYVEKNAKGDFLFWNYVDGDDIAEPNGQMLHAQVSGLPIPAQKANDYSGYIKDSERKKEYDGKVKDLNEKKYHVFVSQINYDLLANVNIPAQIDLGMLMDYLTFEEKPGDE